LRLLYGDIRLNKKLLHLASYGHALDLPFGIHSDYLGNAILAIVIE
jgi:hypothetical protein